MPASANWPERTLISPIFTVPWACAAEAPIMSATAQPSPTRVRFIAILPSLFASLLRKNCTHENLRGRESSALDRWAWPHRRAALADALAAEKCASRKLRLRLVLPSVAAARQPCSRGQNQRNDMSLAGTAGPGEASHFRRIPRANHAPRLIAANAMLPVFLVTLLLFACCGGQAARAEPPASDAPRIEWGVKNRFRLFLSEADFQRHVEAARSGGVLAAERRLASESDGRGWARDIVDRLCVNRAGQLLESCDRDGEREIYLAPRDHRVGVTLAGNVPANEGCVWSFDDGDGHPRQVESSCNEEVKARLVSARPTIASVDITLPDGTALRLVNEIKVPDVLSAGMGDSIAAGEGNPDQPVQLSDEGFCFKRFGGGEYYRPGRAEFRGNKSCAATSEDGRAGDWAMRSARWLSGPCHRSLYSYQMRTALALAVENPRLAVTFLPLGCTGATINAGFLNNQRARECPSPGTRAACSGTARAQIVELTELLATARRYQADRSLDLVLLTIGANDILFSGLIANVMIEPGTEL